MLGQFHSESTTVRWKHVPVGRPLVFVCDEDIQDIVAIAASFILSFQNNP